MVYLRYLLRNQTFKKLIYNGKSIKHKYLQLSERIKDAINKKDKKDKRKTEKI